MHPIRNTVLYRRRILSNILGVLLAVFFILFVAKVYAMAFTLSSSTAESRPTYAISIADLDGDGDLDFIAYNTGPVHHTYMNNGSGLFTGAAFGHPSLPTGIAAFDIDNDGDIDFIEVEESTKVSKHVNNGSGIFTQYEIASGLTFTPSKTFSGDFDNDGDIDFILVGDNSRNAFYANDGHGNFVAAASTLPEANDIRSADFNSDGYQDLMLFNVSRITVMRGSGTGAFVSMFTLDPGGGTIFGFASGDIDGDGDIDIVTVTSDGAEELVPWFNNGIGTSFISGTKTAIVADSKSVSLADLDNDGDLDALVGAGAGSQAYLNNGSGVFTPTGSAIGATDNTRDVEVGDFDNDGDLDYVAGNDGDGAGSPNRIYANDQAATLANTPPTAPSNFTAVKISDNGSTATVRLSWGSGSDTITATKMLQYQLRVGTGSNTHNIISGRTASPNWVTRVMPNGQSRTMLLKNIPCNNTFYWSAASVDTGFMSTWGTEATFNLDATCTLTAGGGSPAPDTGGGLPASWFRQEIAQLEPEPEEVPKATITVSAFIDMNRNAKKDTNENTGFQGLSFTASGRTTTGIKIQETQTLNLNGSASFSLPPSDNQGYSVFVDTGSSLLKDFEPTTPTLTGSFVLLGNQQKSLSFGFVKNDLVHYNPCLTIAAPTEPPPVNTDAGQLLARLHNSFGISILKDITLSGSLIDRRNFFLALQKTHCIPLETNQQHLITSLKKIAPTRNLILPLIDLPLNITLSDASLIYSLLANNIHAERKTLTGPAADLSSPISRREALQTLFDALNIPTHKIIETGATLPLDLKKDDPLVPAYLTLNSLNILPDSFQKTIGLSQGINPTEAATLLTRAAFSAGTISLLPPVLDKSSKPPLKAAAPTKTFLTLLPPLTIPSCLQTIEERSKQFSFTNILPGDPLAKDISTLLTKATTNNDNTLLWLLTGTSRPTEFGIKKGSSTLDLDDAPALLDVIRTLLVLSCIPPETPKVSTTKLFDGSLSTKIPRDMISSLERDISFASRTLYRAQDHQREYELSLFSFAPDLLTKETKFPITPLNLDEASGLLASTLLRMAVLQTLISPSDAEGLAAPLRQEVAQELLGTNLDWREAAILRNTPFTRAMLIQFLATVLQTKTTQDQSLTPEPASLGEMWWERVR